VRRQGPILDHEALLDIIYVKEHPLDVEALRRCPHPVIVTAADVHSGEVVYHDLRQGDAIAWLKATGRLPMGSGPPVAIDGREYLDGGILDPIPVRRAVADGHTDLTVVLNKPQGHRQKDNAVLASIAARRFPKLRQGILHHYQIKSEAFDYCEAPPQGVTVRLVRPSAPPGLGRLTRDPKLIRRAIEAGRADGKAFAEGRPAAPAGQTRSQRRRAGTAA
jgi:predicted patatin/cPLA2 family phospholipase